jgi:spore coat polysaccharide biosynthesis protein SpsF (cytidylyltransferase family)
MRTAVLLQARMGSRRLPGKVLARLGDRTLLAHCVRRLGASGLIVVVTTTQEPEDDAVVAEARRLGAEVFRGATYDVLARFIGAARAFGFTTIVRATADNPFVDADAAGRLLPVLARSAASYVTELSLPVGAAVEAVTIDALERAHALAHDPADREHVTTLVRRDRRFHAVELIAPPQLRRPALRLTVDTAEDLERARAIAAAFETADPLPNLAAVIDIAERLQRRGLTTSAKRGA